MSLRTYVKTDVERRRENLASHELVKTGDPDATGPVVDRNNEVVLGFCRRCHGGEAELEDESCIERLIKLSIAADAKRTPLERAMRSLEGRFGYVAAELTVNDSDEVVRTREEAIAIIERSSPEYIVWKELKRRLDEEARVRADNAETTPSILRGFGRDGDLLEPPRAVPGADGSIRRAHYGEGKQPWDTAVERGWAAKAAALMVIKYLRRDKGTPEKDLRDARWYFDRLVRMVDGKTAGSEEDVRTMSQLNDELTEEELARLEHGR